MIVPSLEKLSACLWGTLVVVWFLVVLMCIIANSVRPLSWYFGYGARSQTFYRDQQPAPISSFLARVSVRVGVRAHRQTYFHSLHLGCPRLIHRTTVSLPLPCLGSLRPSTLLGIQIPTFRLSQERLLSRLLSLLSLEWLLFDFRMFLFIPTSLFKKWIILFHAFRNTNTIILYAQGAKHLATGAFTTWE